jgi:hypothetical protein
VPFFLLRNFKKPYVRTDVQFFKIPQKKKKHRHNGQFIYLICLIHSYTIFKLKSKLCAECVKAPTDM